MKKRLGMIPKGLEWISQEPEIQPATKTSKIHLDQYDIPAAKRGLQEDLTRATFIMQQDHLEKIKAYAYWERIQIKDVIEEMCNNFFEHKKVRSVPGRKKD